MTRALLWKELREQRHLVLAAWLIAAILPLFLVVGMLSTTPDYELSALGQMLPIVVVFLVWPVFGAATGATSVAADLSDNSLRFLFSRPVSRSRIWFVKVLAGAAALTLVIAGSTLIAALFDFMVSGRVRLFGGGDDGSIVVFLVIAGALFIAAHYCSLFFHRPLAAALAGAVVVMGIAGVVGTTWSLFIVSAARGRPGAGTMIAAAAVPLAAVALLGAAWWVFNRGDLFSDNAVGRMAVPLAVVMVSVALVGAVPGAFVFARESVTAAARVPDGVRPIDGSIALVQPTAGGIGARIAYLDLETGAVRLLGARNAAAPTPSPDGSLLAYVTFPGPLGNLLGSPGELRAVRSDGSGDRVVVAEVARPIVRSRVLSVSPDSRFAMLYFTRDLIQLAELAAETVEARYVKLPVPRSGVWYFNVIGWTADAPHEVLYSRAFGRNLRPGNPEARTDIVALDPVTEAERVIATIPGYHGLTVPGRSGLATMNRAWRWLPMWLSSGPGTISLSLLDTSTGERIELSDGACRGWGSDGGSRFLYGHCSGERFDQHMELRVRDLAAGTDEPFAVVDGVQEISRGREMLLSPDRSRAVVFLQRGRRSPATYVITRDGSSIEPLSYSADPLGWIDDDHVAVISFSARWGTSFDIGVVNVQTGSLRPVYSQ